MDEFNKDRALKGIEISKLPITYELNLMKGRPYLELSENTASMLSPQQEMTVLRHGNSTAVVVYDPEKRDIHVSFDASDEFSDKVDDATFWGKDHALGGQVHSGFWNAATRENQSGESLIDKVRDQVKSYAGQSENPLALHLSGFSKGGSVAVIVAGQWLAEKFPAPEDKIELKSVYTFGSPPSGTKEFISNFEKSAKLNGLDTWRVVAENDFVPKVLSQDAPFYMPSLYDHLTNTLTLSGGSHDPDIYESLIRKYTKPDASTLDQEIRRTSNNVPEVPIPAER